MHILGAISPVVALVLLALAGCTRPDDDPVCADVFRSDADADGHGNPEGSTRAGCAAPEGYTALADDCDDGDASVHPSAVEVCNDVDDDCNALTDDGAVDAPSWYLDADGDGHGDPGTSIMACAAPEGYRAQDDDCDDTNAAIHGGAGEVCDALDNDCDVAVDEDLPEGPWYRDADGDGHGDPDTIVGEGCAPPDGYVATPDDCDDLHVHAYDGAPESLTDGVDDACDGVTSVTPAEDLPLWKAMGTMYGELGISIAPGGDFDGDGVPDLALGGGAIEIEKDTWRRTKVVVFSGPFEVSDAFAEDSSSAAILHSGPSDGDRSFVFSAGDLDEDGFGDLLICDSYSAYSATGHAFIVRGPLSGTIDLSDGTQAYAGEELGVCAGPGDVDGDSVPDVLVGSPWAETGGFGWGAVYVLSGPAKESSLDDAGQILGGTIDYETVGDGVVAVGDLDGDGLEDFSVSTANAHVSHSPDGTAAYLVMDHSPGSYHPRDVGVTVRHEDGTAWGLIVSRLDDVNGDGYRDIGFADDGYDAAGLITVIEGPFGAEPSVDLVDASELSFYSSATSGNAMLAWATPLGDWNGDGSGVLALADPGLTSTEARGGSCGPGGVFCMQGGV